MIPDARQDLAGAINHLIAEVEQIKARQDETRLSARAAAARLGYSDSYFRGHPWRIPFFGASGTLHAFSVWKDWLATPDHERRAQWDAMSAKERRAMRGVA